MLSQVYEDSALKPVAASVTHTKAMLARSPSSFTSSSASWSAPRACLEDASGVFWVFVGVWGGLNVFQEYLGCFEGVSGVYIVFLVRFRSVYCVFSVFQ